MRTARYKMPKVQGLNVPYTIENTAFQQLEVKNLVIPFQLYFLERLAIDTHEVVPLPKHNIINP